MTDPKQASCRGRVGNQTEFSSLQPAALNRGPQLVLEKRLRRELKAAPASSVLMVSSLLGSLRPILLKEYMRML